MNKKNIIIATIKSWNITLAEKLKLDLSGSYNFEIITNKETLSLEFIDQFNPQYIFFPHWSWIIPKKIFTKFDCVVFHMTDLPFGRGGSPLQNLIARKVYHTKISAIKVVETLDGGPVFCKRDLNIETGSAEDIFKKLSNIVFTELIPLILENNPQPKEQVGEPTVFRRRKKEQSNICSGILESIHDYYDFIRMLDAEGYPRAFSEHNNLRIEFLNVHKNGNELVGTYRITENEK